MPVLPDVASRIVRSGVSLPEASPSRIIRAAARSFTDPPGFCHSAFAYSSTPGVSRSNWCNRTSGVRPIMSSTDDPGARSRTDEVLEEAIPIYDRTSPDFIKPANPVKLTGIRAHSTRHHDPPWWLALSSPNVPAPPRRDRDTGGPPRQRLAVNHARRIGGCRDAAGRAHPFVGGSPHRRH